MTVERNFFDDLNPIDTEEVEKYNKEQQARGEKIDFLVHKVFAQTDEGQELLTIWKESLMMQPTAEGGLDTVEIGIREGMKRFIRGIILTINRVEKS